MRLIPLDTSNWPGEEHRAYWLGREDSPTEFIYFIQGDPGTPVKIGYTGNIDKRLAALQTGNPQQLNLLLLIPGGMHLEYRYHETLESSRVRGEWFIGDHLDTVLIDAREASTRMVAEDPGEGKIKTAYAYLRVVSAYSPSSVPWGRQNPCGVTYGLKYAAVEAMPEERDRPWRGKTPDWLKDVA